MTVTPLLHDDRYNQYLIRNKRAILSTLRLLLSKNTLINGYLQDVSLVTAILHIDDNFLLLDVSQDEALNKSILKAGQIICFTYESKINIQFELTQITLVKYLNKPAFKCAIPDMVLRLQRREYYRVNVPATNATCLIHPDVESPYLTVKLHDLSGGGIAVTTDDILIEKGIILKDSKIALPDVGNLILDLEVCYNRILSEASRHNNMQLGLKFINLRDKDLVHIQKYIMQIERSRSAHDL